MKKRYNMDKAIYSVPLKEVYSVLKSTEGGLSSREALDRLQKYGPNEIKRGKKTSRLKIFLRQFNNFLIYILIAATIVSLFLKEYFDAIIIFFILFMNSVLGYVQEYRAEKSIEALKKLASLKATVMRDGKQLKIDSTELVPGDLILLDVGEKVPADARLISIISLQTQEGALTGESLPVRKEISIVEEKKPLGDRKNMVYSGTIIVNGKGTAIVSATGMGTEIGKIAHMIQEAKEEIPPLQKKLEVLGKLIGMMVLLICAVVFILGVIRGGELLDTFLIAVSLAVAAIPEGLPAVVTISLALGVERMIKRNALMKKLPSVETLGSTTVICTDKTGTLTKNEMTVRKIFVNNKIIEVSGTGYNPEGRISENAGDLIFKIGVLCNNSKLVKEKDSWQVYGDPTEGCLITVARKAGLDEEALNKKHPRVHEILFDSARKRMTTVHKDGEKKLAYTKGAPDIVLKLCEYIQIDGKVRKITEKDRELILKMNDNFSKDALRVLAFAYQDVTKVHKLDEAEKDLIFVGLQGMIDPPRPEVKEAINKCKTAGIKVIMITGDYKGTAIAIARELGIEGRAVDGSELDNINLDREVENIGVYARVNPEHKMKIVRALKKKGHIVAMTGDGVNDAPALKSADIGVAMGIAGTDVAKEASAMILTDDNFASIVNAVEEGRNIYDNIKKFVFFLMSCNLAEVLVLFVAILIGFSDSSGKIIIPLIAVQILWINLVTDGIPAIALGIDPPDPSIMKRKPRNPREKILSNDLVLNILLIGVIDTIGVLLLFNYELPDVARARTLAMTLLILLELVVAISAIRGQFHTKFFSNRWLYASIALSLALQLILIYTPINTLFKLAPLTIMDWALIGIFCVVSYIVRQTGWEIIRRFVKEG